MYQKKQQPEKGGVDAALDRFADMIIARMQAMKNEQWQKPWISPQICGMPRNLSGRNYNGGNSFFLMLLGSEAGYDKPVYMTFKQAHDNGCHVLKGERSFPVVFWDFNFYDSAGNRVPVEKLSTMSTEQKMELEKRPFMRYYSVFNIDQTNFKEVHPDKYEAISRQYAPTISADTEGMFSHPGLDNMLAARSWVCPINSEKGDRAFYSASADFITVPLKSQFRKDADSEKNYRAGMEYYSTLLHEMSHSTGHQSRLNRLDGGRFGSPKYAKEELVAELTSAMVGSSLGFHASVTDNCAKYLDNWISVLREEPKFIVSLMSDVNKASEMIFRHVQPELSLAKAKEIEATEKKSIDVGRFSSPVVLKGTDGSYSIRAAYDGMPLSEKPITAASAEIFFKLNDPGERELFTDRLLSSVYKSEIHNPAIANRREHAEALHI